MRATLVGAALAVLATSSAVAEPTAKSFLDRIERGDTASRFFLMGAGNGLQWSNVALDYQHKPLLFCLPPKVALAAEQELDILKRYVHERPNTGDMSVGMVLMDAMIDAFPCH